MIPPDFFTLPTLTSAALWGAAGGGAALLVHCFRDRDYLLWRLRRWRDGGIEPYPEPKGYVSDIVTPQERTALPRNVGYFAGMGALFPVLTELGEPIASIAPLLLVAAVGLGAALVDDDAEEIGAPTSERPSRWHRIRPHLLTLALLGGGTLAFVNREALEPVLTKVAGLPPAYFWVAAVLLVLAGAMWLRGGGAAHLAELWADVDHRGLATTLTALACSLLVIGTLVWLMGMW